MITQSNHKISNFYKYLGYMLPDFFVSVYKRFYSKDLLFLDKFGDMIDELDFIQEDICITYKGLEKFAEDFMEEHYIEKLDTGREYYFLPPVYCPFDGVLKSYKSNILELEDTLGNTHIISNLHTYNCSIENSVNKRIEKGTYLGRVGYGKLDSDNSKIRLFLRYSIKSGNTILNPFTYISTEEYVKGNLIYYDNNNNKKEQSVTFALKDSITPLEFKLDNQTYFYYNKDIIYCNHKQKIKYKLCGKGESVFLVNYFVTNDTLAKLLDDYANQWCNFVPNVICRKNNVIEPDKSIEIKANVQIKDIQDKKIEDIDLFIYNYDNNTVFKTKADSKGNITFHIPKTNLKSITVIGISTSPYVYGSNSSSYKKFNIEPNYKQNSSKDLGAFSLVYIDMYVKFDETDTQYGFYHYWKEQNAICKNHQYYIGKAYEMLEDFNEYAKKDEGKFFNYIKNKSWYDEKIINDLKKSIHQQEFTDEKVEEIVYKKAEEICEQNNIKFLYYKFKKNKEINISDDIYHSLERKLNICFKNEKVKSCQEPLPDQGDTSLCGIAAFMYHLLKFRPDLYVKTALDLWKFGMTYIYNENAPDSKGIFIKPGKECLESDYTKVNVSLVDWMTMAGLKDSENYIFDVMYREKKVNGSTQLDKVLEFIENLPDNLSGMTFTWELNILFENLGVKAIYNYIPYDIIIASLTPLVAGLASSKKWDDALVKACVGVGVGAAIALPAKDHMHKKVRQELWDYVKKSEKDNEQIIIALVDLSMVNATKKKVVSIPDHWVGLAKDFNNPQGKPLCFSWGKVDVLDSIDNDDYSDCMFGGMVFDTKNLYGVCDDEK